ncbi:hypothetical protein ANO11243_085080 [Dothideomycetidae sp. 11243]|nr:hypothetical protein ANO11243_085080 [fungal sp. No.11243]
MSSGVSSGVEHYGPAPSGARKDIQEFTEIEGLEKLNTADVDDAILRAQGHEAELERSFSLWGVVGLAFSITNSWLTYAACFGLVLVAGGGLTALVGVIIAAITQWIVLLGLAELSSAMPSAGGQYHYTFLIAPERTRTFAAYVVGFMNIIAWWANLASGTIYVAISTFGIVNLWYPDISGAQWQVYLTYLLVLALTLVPTFVVPQRQLDKMTQGSMYLSILGLVLVVLIVLIMGRGRYKPENLSTFSGSSGWSPGVGWMLGIATGEYCFFGTGACVHLAEELPRPARRLPRVISNLTMIIGVATSVIWIIVILCVIQDISAVQAASVPNLEVMLQATGSKAAATFIQAYLTLLYYTCCPSQIITASRITWAFARDNGLPYSDYFKVVSKTYQIPVRTAMLSVVFCAIYGLLWIASTQAFNSLVNTAILLLNLTFTVPQGILLFHGRDRLPTRPFSLGKFGYAVNAFSVVWLIVSGTFLCFPNSIPAELNTMNYNSVVIVGLMVIVIACWLERRKKFKGPIIDLDALNANAALE